MCCLCGGGTTSGDDQDMCQDLDNGATDSWGDNCVVYEFYPEWCGTSDDNDFKSYDMCCACGGGSNVDEITTLIPETTVSDVCYDLDHHVVFDKYVVFELGVQSFSHVHVSITSEEHHSHFALEQQINARTQIQRRM